MADAAAAWALRWALESPWCMQQLLLPASPLGARLHGLTLTLARTGASTDGGQCQEGLKVGGHGLGAGMG